MDEQTCIDAFLSAQEVCKIDIKTYTCNYSSRTDVKIYLKSPFPTIQEFTNVN